MKSWWRMRRGGLLIELSVVMVVLGLAVGLLTPLEIHMQRAGEAMKAQARCAAAAREAAAQIRRDVQEASAASVSAERLALRLAGGSITYEREAHGWVRRSSRASEPPVWLRDEVRSIRFRREGRAVCAAITCESAAGSRYGRPIRLEVLALPRNGGAR